MPAKSTLSFTYAPSPARIVFGPGTLSRVGDEVTGLGGKRACPVDAAPKADAEALAAALGSRAAGSSPRRRCTRQSR